MAFEPTPASAHAGAEPDDKDKPLRDDIRLLGRILGDTVREQEGEETFGLVELIRQASIRFHRHNEPGARRELEATLDSLSADQTLAIVRAFSYFSHLANIAEDQHHIRRNRAHVAAGSAPRPGSLAYAFHHLRHHISQSNIAPEAVSAFFDGALVSPVLTAHPTEVRRKSTLIRELEIADLLDERDHARSDAAELAAIEDKLRRAVLILWRTNLLRQKRLLVIDEVANGLSYYDYTFFNELPRLYGEIEDALGVFDPGRRGARVPSFLRIGSWIGGDRDGNPYVTSQVLDEAVRRQSARALAYYLDELHELGGELSLASGLAKVSAELAALADRADDEFAHPEQRALPARDRRNVRPPRRDRTRPRSRGGAAPSDRRCAGLCVGRGARRRSRRDRRVAQGERRDDHRPRAPEGAPSRRRCVRLPPGADRPSAEFRRARAHGGGAFRRGLAGPRLSAL